MKISVSVPDELWLAAHGDSPRGRSDTVQRALRLLAGRQQATQQPLANAPDQSDLERYRPAFETAVSAAATSLRVMLDNGYRYGLLVAGGLTGGDFDALDERGAAEEMRAIVSAWGDPDHVDLDLFSYEFCEFVGSTFERWENAEDLKSALDELLGSDEAGAPGVKWVSLEGSDRVLPELSRTFVEGILRALRDVRDETVRRLSSKTEQHEGGDR